MHQYIGLILLILAVAGVVYVVSHTDDLLQLKLPIPDLIRPVSLSVPSVPKLEKESVPEISSTPEIKEPETKELETRELVRISSIKWATSYHPQEVVLSSNVEKGETVNITGWTVKGNFGSFRIPRAQEIYSFGGLQQDIVLHYRDKVHFYSGRGPKGNFRLNKCLGYIEDVSPFTPSIPKRCPHISKSEINHLSSYCQDYILSLKTCENPSTNPPVPLDDFSCHDYLKSLSYIGCVEKCRNDKDFLLDEWRVWLGEKINIFDSRHDKIQLLDKEGNIIDEYSY